MAFCKCELPKTVEILEHWDHCPLEDFGYTDVYIQKCRGCGRTCGFPQENFDIALKKGTKETKDALMNLAVQAEGGG